MISLDAGSSQKISELSLLNKLERWVHFLSEHLHLCMEFTTPVVIVE